MGCRGVRDCNLDSGNKFEHQSTAVLVVQFIKVTKAILPLLVYISLCECLYFYTWHALKEKERAKEAVWGKKMFPKNWDGHFQINLLCFVPIYGLFGAFLLVVVLVLFFLIIYKRFQQRSKTYWTYFHCLMSELYQAYSTYKGISNHYTNSSPIHEKRQNKK